MGDVRKTACGDIAGAQPVGQVPAGGSASLISLPAWFSNREDSERSDLAVRSRFGSTAALATDWATGTSTRNDAQLSPAESAGVDGARAISKAAVAR